MKTVQQRFEESAFWQTLGFEYGHAEDGIAEIAFNFHDDLTNVVGTLHGGVFMAALDTVMGIATHTLGFDKVVTMQMETRFLKPITEGRIQALGRVISHTRSTVILEGRLYDENQELVGFATATFKGSN
ncbi:PaaI family thioesterase [Rummeliibacillus pycnus]|uniref:PaaI family thioesterase n=1 Tax=Rummeliibacillus pycnus TaxID=101070 RepID=UPI0037C5B56C